MTLLWFRDKFENFNFRYLELQSSGRKDEIRLHYTSQMDDMVHVEAFPYRLADNSWHKLAVTVSGSQVELLVDCHPLYRRLLQRTPDTNFTLPQLTLWVGQRNNRHSLFKVGGFFLSKKVTRFRFVISLKTLKRKNRKCYHNNPYTLPRFTLSVIWIVRII